MTLEKAIELRETELKEHSPGCDPDFYASECLLIEAAKRILRQRRLKYPTYQPPLPGEDIV